MEDYAGWAWVIQLEPFKKGVSPSLNSKYSQHQMSLHFPSLWIFLTACSGGPQIEEGTIV